MTRWMMALAMMLAMGQAWAQGTSGTSGAAGATAPATPAPAAQAQGQPPGQTQGDALNGKQLFAADGCYECHGYVGQGSIRTAPALAPNTPPFVVFQLQLRHPSDRMPPYTDKVLSDSDMHDIYAYLLALPKPPQPADIAILQN
jgi:cytochrome c553